MTDTVQRSAGRGEEKEVLIPFEEVDFTNQDQIIQLFPNWKREQIAVSRMKGVSKAVNIEPFTLKTPFGDQYLLRDTELILEPGKRQGLVGANGTGKTLLFVAMASYSIKGFPKHLHVHHCKEIEIDKIKNESVLDTVVHSHEFRNILVRCEDKLKSLMEETAPGPKYDALKANLDYVEMNMRSVNGYTAYDRASKMLRVLGFDEIGEKKLISELSGGLKMRVALCCAFFIEAELLLLDEPTNHLDFPSVLWLENRLRGYKGAFLMVSHDRELLQNVCTSVMLIEDKSIHYYACGFKEFERKKAAEDKKKSEDVEKFLAKHKNVDFSSPIGRQKEDKKNWLTAYVERQVQLAGKFTFPASRPLENKDNLPDPSQISLINLENVRFSYNPNKPDPVYIFDTPISFNVRAGTRVGVMGPNGAGKSTFLKLLTGKLTPTSGTVTPHPSYTLAYFGQHSTMELDMEMTPIEFMKREFPDHKEGLLKNHLAKASIGPGPANTRMQSLSFSQRSCIIFAKLTYIAPHLLIMDEPTNFLDLESVDSLIAASNKYQGALLLVSHNRDFLKKCARQYLSIVPGKFEVFDELKAAERATYTFVAELEAGPSSTALKGNITAALANNSGETGKKKAEAEKKEEKKGDFVFGGQSAAAKALEAKEAAARVAKAQALKAAQEKKPAAGGAKGAGGRGAKAGGRGGAKAAGGRGRGGR